MPTSTITPDRYFATDADVRMRAIERRRAEIGESLLILCHHYQRDEVVQHADFVGDSLRLSQQAAERCADGRVRWVVFCGVHFMAETADVLTDESVAVLLPDAAATCPMAGMVDDQQLQQAWQRMTALDADAPAPVTPIAYVNSSAAVKAFVGAHGGACCTSSNALEVFRWALRANDSRILFVPDEHLGRNVACRIGLSTDGDMVVWDPNAPGGGVTDDQLRAARVVLWRGHCYVHARFRPQHVDALRREYADRGGIRVIVHPECVKEVVDRADETGSTEHIVRRIEQAEPGSRWAIGTEAHLVARLARHAAARDVEVRMLGPTHAMCGAMLHVSDHDLLWTLDNLAIGREANRVRVAPEHREPARLAVMRMLRLGVR